MSHSPPDAFLAVLARDRVRRAQCAAVAARPAPQIAAWQTSAARAAPGPRLRSSNTAVALHAAPGCVTDTSAGRIPPVAGRLAVGAGPIRPRCRCARSGRTSPHWHASPTHRDGAAESAGVGLQGVAREAAVVADVRPRHPSRDRPGCGFQVAGQLSLASNRAIGIGVLCGRESRQAENRENDQRAVDGSQSRASVLDRYAEPYGPGGFLSRITLLLAASAAPIRRSAATRCASASRRPAAWSARASNRGCASQSSVKP